MRSKSTHRSKVLVIQYTETRKGRSSKHRMRRKRGLQEEIKAKESRAKEKTGRAEAKAGAFLRQLGATDSVSCGTFSKSL